MATDQHKYSTKAEDDSQRDRQLSEMSASEETRPAPPPPPPFTPPDGGRAAWQTVAAGWLCQFCSFGFINA